jgi:hypothetical protein
VLTSGISPTGRLVCASLPVIVVILVFPLCHGTARPDDAVSPPGIESIRRSADAGLAWLLARQQRDGAWGSGRFESSAAVTAAAGLALLASGSTPASGPHAEAVGRCVERLLETADADGVFFTAEPGSAGPMYGHAFATLLLAEVIGETDGDRVREAVTRAVGAIEASQSVAGGWRYQAVRRAGRPGARPTEATPPTAGGPDPVGPGDADASVTAAVLTALAAAGRAGVPVSRECVARGRHYLLSTQNGDGGFRYLSAAGPAAAPRTAAALLALAVTPDPSTEAASDEHDALERGYRWLATHPVGFTPRDAYTLYGVSAATGAWWQRGGENWRNWYLSAAAHLVSTQAADGSWTDPNCDEYGTAAALSTLLAPDGLLPVLQP